MDVLSWFYEWLMDCVRIAKCFCERGDLFNLMIVMASSAREGWPDRVSTGVEVAGTTASVPHLVLGDDEGSWSIVVSGVQISNGIQVLPDLHRQLTLPLLVTLGEGVGDTIDGMSGPLRT